MAERDRMRRRYERQSSGRLVGAIVNNQLSDDAAALARQILWERDKGRGRLSGPAILAMALIGIAAGLAAGWAVVQGLVP